MRKCFLPFHLSEANVSFFSPLFQIIAKRGVKYLHCHGPKVHQELWGMSTRDAMFHFIKEACQLEDVPVTFYRLQKVMSQSNHLTFICKAHFESIPHIFLPSDPNTPTNATPAHFVSLHLISGQTAIVHLYNHIYQFLSSLYIKHSSTE